MLVMRMGVALPLAVLISKRLLESIDDLLVCNMHLVDCSGMDSLYKAVNEQKELLDASRYVEFQRIKSLYNI